MATYQAVQQIGVIDGSVIPANKTDSRIVDAATKVTIATKDYTARNAAAPALANTDKVYLGRLRAGELLEAIEYLTDTTLGATTVSIGTIALPTKYVNAQTMTAINTWTALAQAAANFTAGAVTADEEIYLTANGAVAAAIIAHFKLRTTGIH